HHPHLVARDLHVALDLAGGGAQPSDEPLKRRRFTRLIIERQGEKFVEGVGGLEAEALEHAAAPAVAAEHAGIEGEGALAPCRLGPSVELDRRCGEFRRGAGRERSAERARRLQESAKMSSSSKPNSGLFSTVASARSSAGSSSVSASTIRSMTAMCSASFSRSAPATATPLIFSARMTASNKGPRWRTR